MVIARQRCLVTTLLLFLIHAPAVVPNIDENPDLPYLYDEDAGVVIEYMPSADVVDPLRPDFLYSTNNGPRIVEFYAPWCPACQDFRDHFVEFAGQMIEGARAVGVDDLKIYTISCQAHRQICKDWEFEVFPQLLLFRAGETNTTGKSVYYKLKPNSVFKSLQIPAFIDESKNKEKKLKEREQRRETKAAASKQAKHDDIFKDALISFHFAIRNGIFMADGPLPIKARAAFENWLNLLHRAIPVASSLHAVVSALLDDFEFIVEDENALLEVEFRFAPDKMKWSKGCTHGTRGAGYTCGLWNLFHIVTVGVTEWNQLSLIDPSMAIGVEDAAVTISDFVENFFGCAICRINFKKAFDACAHNRCTRLDNNATSMSEWREFPLWLFETHNSVNIRILHEKGERKDFTPTPQDEINKQWPARDSCLNCWLDDGGWVEDHVIEHLKIDYWPEISASFLDQQRDFFNEQKVEVEAARRFLVVPDTKQEFAAKSQEHNSGEARLDVESELVEDMDGNEEKEVNSEESRIEEARLEEARLEESRLVESRLESMDDDVSRKDSFYDFEKDDGKQKVAHFIFSPGTVGLFLFIAVIVGLVVTWYARKLQHKRSGLHKKLDLAAPYMPVGTALKYGWEQDEW